MKIGKIIVQSFRMLCVYRSYTSINVCGLALGLACVMALSQYVYRECTTDRGHRLPVACVVETERNGGLAKIGSLSATRTADLAFIQEKTENVMYVEGMGITANGKDLYADLIVSDSNFYKVFDFPFLAGDPRQALRNPADAIVSAEFAEKVFGKENPVGKRIRLLKNKEVTVTGVVDLQAANTAWRFDMQVAQGLTRFWGRMGADFYAVTDPAMLAVFNAESQFEKFDWGEYRYELHPFADTYWDRGIGKTICNFRSGNRTNVYVLGIVALLILLVSLFNYANVYRVVLQKRSREIGVKRVFGAGDGTMLFQFFMENIWVTTAAMALGWGLIVLCADFFRTGLGMDITGEFRFNMLLTFLLWIGLPALLTLYPYGRYVRRMPVRTVRFRTCGNGRALLSKYLFLVMQYTITIFVIILSLGFMKQLRHMLRADLGYRPERIVNVSTIGYSEWLALSTEEQIDMFRNETSIADRLDRIPGIEAFCYGDPPNRWSSTWTDTYAFQGKKYTLVCGYAPKGYFDVYGIPVRMQLPQADSLQASDGYCYLNESAWRLLGQADLDSLVLEAEDQTYRVLGVVGDYYFDHLSKQASPMIFWAEMGNGDLREGIHVRFREDNREAVLKALKEIHAEYFPGKIFEYAFLQDEVAEMYREDRRIAVIYGCFALIAVFISSLGLFSLSLFDVQQRYREIAIRKVNGASIGELMRLLTGRYYLLLAAAFVLAAPSAAYALTVYLQGFAVKTPLSWWIFAVAGGLTALVSLLTLWWHMWHAATENPAKAIKFE